MHTPQPHWQLISPRSPSYERASREFLHPTATAHPQVIAILARLSEAECDAARACMSVAQRLADPLDADRLRAHAATHEARRQALARMITTLGGSAPRAGESRQILVQTSAAVDMVSTPAAGTLAIQVMRDELAAAYSEAMASPHLEDAQRRALLELAPGPAHA